MGKMSDEIKKKRLAELLGMELPVEAPKLSKEQIKSAQDISREAEAVLFYIFDSRKFIQRECTNCGYTFAVNRGNVGYCSDTCREHALAKIGISWDHNKDQDERWDFREPLEVPPQVLKHLEPYVQPETPENQEEILTPTEGQPAEELDEIAALLAGFDV